VPANFYLALTPYRGMSDAFKVEAKLRYRISKSEGGLKLHYAIPDLERVMERAYDDVLKLIAEKTGLQVFEGAA